MWCAPTWFDRRCPPGLTTRGSHVGQESLGELQRRADIQIHHRDEPLEIHGINGLMPGDADSIDDSKHVLARGQILGESAGLILVRKVCVDKYAWKTSGGQYAQRL